MHDTTTAGRDAIDIPIYEDEVRVSRETVTHGYATDTIPEGAFQNIEIEIPIRGEEIVISTRLAVREVVSIGKVLREREHTFRETIRREDVRVERIAAH